MTGVTYSPESLYSSLFIKIHIRNRLNMIPTSPSSVIQVSFHKSFPLVTSLMDVITISVKVITALQGINMTERILWLIRGKWCLSFNCTKELSCSPEPLMIHCLNLK